MTNRSILTVILLSIFTCGIYLIYWMYVTTEELNANDPTEPLTNYIVAIILSIVTCFIYLFISYICIQCRLIPFNKLNS